MDDTMEGAAASAEAPTANTWRPAQRLDPVTGRPRVDYRAVMALALPLMLNSSLQAVISLTDTWFVGHISTAAMAGMAGKGRARGDCWWLMALRLRIALACGQACLRGFKRWRCC